jgi:hypothetical protein
MKVCIGASWRSATAWMLTPVSFVVVCGASSLVPAAVCTAPAFGAAAACLRTWSFVAPKFHVIWVVGS